MVTIPTPNPENMPIVPRVRYALANAQQEILNLRQSNAILAAKVEVLDIFAMALRASPPSQNFVGRPDIASEIEDLLRIDEGLRNRAKSADYPTTSGEV